MKGRSSLLFSRGRGRLRKIEKKSERERDGVGWEMGFDRLMGGKVDSRVLVRFMTLGVVYSPDDDEALSTSSRNVDDYAPD